LAFLLHAGKPVQLEESRLPQLLSPTQDTSALLWDPLQQSKENVKKCENVFFVSSKSVYGFVPSKGLQDLLVSIFKQNIIPSP